MKILDEPWEYMSEADKRRWAYLNADCDVLAAERLLAWIDQPEKTKALIDAMESHIRNNPRVSTNT